MKISVTSNAQIIKHWGRVFADYELIKQENINTSRNARSCMFSTAYRLNRSSSQMGIWVLSFLRNAEQDLRVIEQQGILKEVL